jgi:cytochrome P450
VDEFAVLFMDLFQGGSETTGGFMEWIILFMILNPQKQKKLQEEIDSILPNMKPCTLEDMDK